MSFFQAAFQVVVGVEGGYTPPGTDDPGGETKFGISKRAYPNLDIANLTLEAAQAIYLKDYWTPAGCDSLSWEMALCLFDGAVNQGLGYEHTLTHGDAIEVMAQRALRYARNPRFAEDGHGWLRRLFSVFKAAQRTPP